MSAVRQETAIAEKAAPAQYLTFRIGGETYAVSILIVREILQYETVTKVPATPRSIRGVMNLRGSVVPVVDLAVKFGLPESALTNRTCVVILEVVGEHERMVMGVMADAVSEVLELRPEDIEPPPPFGSRVRVDYLVGMGKADKKFLLVLDIDKVLSADDLEAASLVGDEAAAGAVPVEPAVAASAKPAPGAESEPSSSPAQAAPNGENASGKGRGAGKAKRRKAAEPPIEHPDGHEPAR